jgi:hypothetical protein
MTDRVDAEVSEPAQRKKLLRRIFSQKIVFTTGQKWLWRQVSQETRTGF